MTRQEQGRAMFQRDGKEPCPTCGGAGSVGTKSWETRSRKGGVNAAKRSMEPGQLSMTERGRLGGRPKLPTLEDVENQAN